MSPSFSSTKLADAIRILRLCRQRMGCRAILEDMGPGGVSPEDLVERVADIVSRNLASGRAGWVMAGQRIAGLEDGALQAYVDRVIDCYLQEHGRIEGLAARDRAEWGRLHEQLARRAWRALQSQPMSPDRAAEEARDLAQETCGIIFLHPFPYDVPFDAWAGRILLNRILHRRTRSHELMDRRPCLLSLDGPDSGDGDDGFSLYELLADADPAYEQAEAWEWLLEGVAQLRSQDQQQVIVDTFLYELGDEEIAGRMGKSMQAMYSLRHRALRNLKKTLEKRKDEG